MTKSKCCGAELDVRRWESLCSCGASCDMATGEVLVPADKMPYGANPTDTKPETDEKQRNKADNDWADRCAKDHSVTKQEETFYACLLRAALAEGRRRQAAETAQREEAAARWAWEYLFNLGVQSGLTCTFESYWKRRQGA